MFSCLFFLLSIIEVENPDLSSLLWVTFKKYRCLRFGMDDEFIQLKKVTKTFGKNKVLDGVDFSIPEGKITGIIGASGEGKSTMLKLIASFYKPTSGDILYFRRDVDKDSQNLKKSFGLAIEDGSFYEDLTVYENLFHFGRLYGVNRKTLKERISGILKFVGLLDARDVLVKNLSCVCYGS